VPVEPGGEGAVEPKRAACGDDREEHEGKQVQGVSPEVEVGVQEHQPDRRDQEQPTDCREAGSDPEQEADPDGEFSDVLQSPEKSPVG